MIETQYVQLLARYNAWANERLYGACVTLPDAERRLRRRAFFGSIHNTLNHLLLVDRLWMGRIEDVPSGITALDTILYDDFDALRAARVEEDKRLIAFADALPSDRLGGSLHYVTTEGEAKTMRLAVVIAHLFNHQTHHRGQIHDMLSQTDVPPPSLDLVLFPGARP